MLLQRINELEKELEGFKKKNQNLQQEVNFFKNNDVKFNIKTKRKIGHFYGQRQKTY